MNKTITLDKVSIWYNQSNEHIHMTVKHKGVEEISTINANPVSKRGNPNLYYKLAKCLRKADAPHPDLPDVST